MGDRTRLGRFVNYDTESRYEAWIVPARTRWRKKPGHRAEIRRCWLQVGRVARQEDWKLRHKTKVRATVGEAIRDAHGWLVEHGGETDGT